MGKHLQHGAAAGGDLAGTYPSPTLAASGATAGSYGSGSAVPVLTVDAKGRVTSITTTPVTSSGGVADPGSNGLMVRTASNVTTARSVTAGSSKVSVTNGDGVSGNIAIDIAEGNITLANLAGSLPATKMPALTGDVTTSAGAVATTIAAGAVTLAKMANLAANSIIGNNTASPATPLALTAAQVKTLLAIAAGDVSGLGSLATASSVSLSTQATGTLQAAQAPAHTGDVTSSAGSLALTIASGAVTLAKMANLAANSIIGNNTGSAATPVALTAAQVKTLLAIATGDVSGLGTIATQASSNVSITGGSISGTRRTKLTANTSAPGATPTINTDTTEYVDFTGLAAAITSMTTNLTGTPNRGDTLWISFTDDGTARAITWGTKFEASTVALPTTTVASTRLDVGFIWNTVTSKWRCVAVA